MAAESTFNYFVGGLALLSTLFSMLVCLNIYLPGPRMKVFDELLVETKSIYEKAHTEGLLPLEMSRNARIQLQEYDNQGDDLRTITYRTPFSLNYIFLSFFGGHSSKIAGLSRDLMELRGDLLTISQKERARRREELARQEREGNRLSIDPISQNPEPSNLHADFPRRSEQASHNAENTSITSTSSVIHRPRYPFHTALFTFIGSSMEWFSARRTPFSFSFVQFGGEDDLQPSLSDVEASSRSSTLVEEPLPKDSSMRRPWSFLVRWVQSRDNAGGDLEASLGASTPSSILNTCTVPGDPQQVNMDASISL